jgi:hypothetical protein
MQLALDLNPAACEALAILCEPSECLVHGDLEDPRVERFRDCGWMVRSRMSCRRTTPLETDRGAATLVVEAGVVRKRPAVAIRAVLANLGPDRPTADAAITFTVCLVASAESPSSSLSTPPELTGSPGESLDRKPSI